ncbi:MAG TPA: DUF11 domain-containing protein [Bryobacteraceae bacterium]|nr:DUF11 domain-containing protein [Bryobacteraceae bacterium]
MTLLELLASRIFSRPIATVLFAVCAAAASAQVAPPATQVATSSDGLLTLALSSTNPSDTTGVDNTYTWTAINNSKTTTLTGVLLGSHWGDWCGGNCTPPGPTLISIAPGCAGQGASEIPLDAHFGVWCTPTAGVTLSPGQSVSGSVTLRPGSGGPPDYTVYTGYNDPVTGKLHFPPDAPFITRSSIVAPAATDIQINGAASNGSPSTGSEFTYTYQVKNAGPWGTYGGIVFVDTLPASLTHISSSVTLTRLSPQTGQPATGQSFCSAVGQTVMCPIPDMQNGGLSGQATIVVTVSTSSVAQEIVNTASVHTILPQEDSNTANNSVTITVVSR